MWTEWTAAAVVVLVVTARLVVHRFDRPSVPPAGQSDGVGESREAERA